MVPRGVKRWRGRSRTHPWWRTAPFYTGLATIVLAIESPIDRLGEHHFTFHVVQHEMFVMLGAPLMLLGAPTTPLLRGAPRWVRREMVPSLSRSRTFRSATHVLTHPVVGLVFLLGLLWAWHLAPGWYDAALGNDLIHDLQHGSFIAAGFLFWWPVIDPAPLYSPMNYPLRVPYLFVAALGKIVLATVLAFSSEPLYSGYANVTPIVGLTRMQDQVTGAYVMLTPSTMMFAFVAAGLIGLMLVKRERSEHEQSTLPHVALNRASARATTATTPVPSPFRDPPSHAPEPASGRRGSV